MLVRFLDTLMDQKGLGLFAQYVALRLFVNQTDLRTRPMRLRR